jgi:hypothetical protein
VEEPDGSIAAGQSEFGGYMIFRGQGMILALSVSAAALVAPQAKAQATHPLRPTPKTVAWGSYDAKAASKTVASDYYDGQ